MVINEAATLEGCPPLLFGLELFRRRRGEGDGGHSLVVHDNIKAMTVVVGEGVIRWLLRK